MSPINIQIVNTLESPRKDLVELNNNKGIMVAIVNVAGHTSAYTNYQALIQLETGYFHIVPLSYIKAIN